MSAPHEASGLRVAPKPASEFAGSFEFPIHLGSDFLQTVTFDLPRASPLTLDEPAPLGTSAGPNPARLLAAAVGGCLGASLAFCLRKSHIAVAGISTTVRGTLLRNEHGRIRVGSISVLLEPVVAASDYDRIPRCLSVFEDYCVVTASIRSAVAVDVRVEPTLISSTAARAG